MPPVSIIATVLNEVEDIARLVPSLIEQNPPPAEIVIVDGGSTDGTWQWLEDAARTHPNLLPIRDESCNLKNCPGPVSRGRNVAIAAAKSEIIACVDAGCTYAPDWMDRITAPLIDSSAQYVLGGSCLDLVDPTVWDIASAHFFGVKLSRSEPSKSCTARSMAFTKDLWQRIGGFPETVLLGEDTLFDLEARRLTPPAFVDGAKAIYRPQNTLLPACRQLARYAISDGILGVRRARLFRNASRCLLHLLALLSLPWTILPLLVVFAIQCWLAYQADWRFIFRFGPRVILARFVFSVLVPWVVSINHIHGIFNKKNPNNRQNLDSASPPLKPASIRGDRSDELTKL
jgi:glycosyltransferase involved in cell wall biosynthesis